jgi:uncharacterized protein RhaS with RHS repeats
LTDPYEGSHDLNEPQSFNRYSYVQNDPVNFIDPTGLLTTPGASCSTNGEYDDGIVGNDGICYPGPAPSVTVDGGGDSNGLMTGFFSGYGPPLPRRTFDPFLGSGEGPGGLPGKPPNTPPTSSQNKAIICPPVRFKVTGIGAVLQESGLRYNRYVSSPITLLEAYS